eukprot:NODE_2101_length_653_cov_91.775665_g2051_i0.p1 GENE.NODE_2101_length_653_cov_91.775665_g2051_i0~~NODE_2101_length_653_cov_91.775665_g2051_i0.p1  ORF type:complete len:131 (-),score=46.79 NODE_2101_length_653_cov_91.775665_g2051_i0:53-445(-)
MAGKKATRSGKGKKKAKAVSHKFTINCEAPAADEIFSTPDFEKFLHDRIKVNGKAGNLGESVAVSREGNVITITANIDFSKRYLKYLTKKFLKKHSLRDWLRVVSSAKGAYEIKYFKIQNDDEDEEEADA